MPIRLVLVDDHPALICGLASIFESENYVVAGTAEHAAGLVQLVRTARPDIVITDLSMPGDIFAAIRTAIAEGVRVVVFTAYADTSLAVRVLKAGALGFVLKGRPSDDLFQAVRAASQGHVFVSPDFQPRILATLHQAETTGERQPDDVLTVRERQIVDGLLRARTNKEIARELDLSEKTIKHYKTNLMAKLGAKNRLDVALAMRAAPEEAAPRADVLETLAGE